MSEYLALPHDLSKDEKGFTDKFLVSRIPGKFMARTCVDLSCQDRISRSEVLREGRVVS